MPTVNEIITELEELRIRETHLIQALKEAVSIQGDIDTEILFVVGDRVRIKRYSRPFITRRTDVTTDVDHATVTKVEKDRISITTDSGTATWRKPKNLVRL